MKYIINESYRFTLFNTWYMEKEMATHSCILAGKIPWTGEPGRLQSVVSQRVGHNLATEQQQYMPHGITVRPEYISVDQWSSTQQVSAKYPSPHLPQFLAPGRCSRIIIVGTPLVVQWLILHLPMRGAGLIPGWEAQMPYSQKTKT